MRQPPNAELFVHVHVEDPRTGYGKPNVLARESGASLTERRFNPDFPMAPDKIISDLTAETAP
jgi:hypothetical protein